MVDGVERYATAWPDWAITTVVDTRAVWPAGTQSFYRAFSLVNGGRQRETDLFEGLRGD